MSKIIESIKTDLSYEIINVTSLLVRLLKWLIRFDSTCMRIRKSSALLGTYYTSTDQRGATRRGLEWLVATGVLQHSDRSPI